MKFILVGSAAVIAAVLVTYLFAIIQYMINFIYIPDLFYILTGITWGIYCILWCYAIWKFAEWLAD